MAISDALPAIDGSNGSARRLEKASLAYPSQTSEAFALTPLLTLPPSFGAAYVGETFACTLCANNEAPASSSLAVRDVTIRAELQTPSTQPKGVELDVVVATAATEGAEGNDVENEELDTGASIQGIVKHDLKEEGPHVLAVTVTYTEASSSAGTQDDRAESKTTVRTFRKLYQFVAQQAIGVRSKVGEVQTRRVGGDGAKGKVWILEAQLENQTEQTVLLNAIKLDLARGVKSRALKDAMGDNGIAKQPLLAPQDVEQIGFLIEQYGEDLEENAGSYVLAQLSVDWRLAMGQQGILKTGWLGSRRR